MYSFKLYAPVYKSVRPIDSSILPLSKIPVSKYFRSSLDCDCTTATEKGTVTTVFKDSSCCKSDKEKIVRTAIFNNKTNQSGYFANRSQYLKKRCMSYDSKNNCCNC